MIRISVADSERIVYARTIEIAAGEDVQLSAAEADYEILYVVSGQGEARSGDLVEKVESGSRLRIVTGEPLRLSAGDSMLMLVELFGVERTIGSPQ